MYLGNGENHLMSPNLHANDVFYASEIKKTGVDFECRQMKILILGMFYMSFCGKYAILTAMLIHEKYFQFYPEC